MAAGTNFEGDRGANRLAMNNERELVPYFVEEVRHGTPILVGSGPCGAVEEHKLRARALRCSPPVQGARAARNPCGLLSGCWQNGTQVVNEALTVQQQQQQSKGGRGKGSQAATQKAAPAGRAAPSRPAAVQQKPAAPKAAKHDKWAGGAFLNCPAPSALPIPSIAMPAGPVAHAAAPGGAAPSFQDPAIVTSSSQQMAAGGAQAHRPGARVHAQFLDNEWYDGVVCGNWSGGHLILFDGFESEGAYEIAFDVIRPLNASPSHQHAQPAHFPAPGQAGIGGGMPAAPQVPAQPAPPPPTSLADLEKQLLAPPPPPARGEKKVAPAVPAPARTHAQHTRNTRATRQH